MCTPCWGPEEEALMSQVLYALVILQGSSGLTFSPGYTTVAECMQQYKGPNVGPSKGRPPMNQ